MSTATTKFIFPYAFALLSGLGLAASSPAGPPSSGAMDLLEKMEEILAGIPPEHFDRIPPAASFAQGFKAGFKEFESRLPRIANLVYWRSFMLEEEYGIDSALVNDGERMSRFLANTELLPKADHPFFDELLHEAYRRRFALPHDESTKPDQRELQLGFYAPLALLSKADRLYKMSINLEILNCAFDEASDEAWARENPGGGSPLQYHGFKIGRIKPYALQMFPRDPGCAQLFTKTAARYLKNLPSDLTPEKNALLRREAYIAAFKKDLMLTLVAHVKEVNEAGEALRAEAEREFRARCAQVAADQAQALKEARALAERKRDEAKRAEERKALVDLAVAEAAPPTAEDKAREQARRAEDRAQAKALRQEARESKKQRQKEDLKAMEHLPLAEMKEEKVGKPADAWCVEWHPEARKELNKNVAKPLTERIDQFVRENLRALQMPHARLLENGEGIWELRPLGSAGAWRPLCAKIRGKVVILSVAPESEVNNSVFQEALKRAQARRDEMVVAEP